jgi:hypothetical protein
MSDAFFNAVFHPDKAKIDPAPTAATPEKESGFNEIFHPKAQHEFAKASYGMAHQARPSGVTSGTERPNRSGELKDLETPESFIG